MTLLVEVAFKGNRKEFFRWDADEAPGRAVAVIVDADRGEDLGYLHSAGEEAELRSARVPHGLLGAEPPRAVKRCASADDIARSAELRADDEDARRRAAERVRANALVMKVTDAEWQWDRKKLTFYFTAEKRVDFRTLVRELASMFRTRIELKQIGVRDEARRLDGVGRCGRQYCSASWLPELRPVNLGVAKDQRLSLNPSQISGACGRLMCCLRYEHEFYVESRRKYPKELRTILASKGEEKVIANDIFRERVTLRAMDGEFRVVPLDDLREEMRAAGDPAVPQLDAAARAFAGALVMTPTPAAQLPEPLARRRPQSMSGVQADAAPPTAEPSRRSQPAAQKQAAAPKPPEPLVPPTAEPRSALATPPDTAAADADRPARRRGRRGGRRNRSGGSTGSDAGNPGA